MSLTIYRASAGSGKTYTLTRSFVQQLLVQKHPKSYVHQLAITFTRKATEEMKRRILELLGELSSPSNDYREEQKRAKALRSAILHDYGRFSVYTIDGFFQRIVRSFLWEAGFPPAYSVELDTKRLIQESIEQVVDEVATHEQNRKWIGAILREQIEEGRKWNVQEALGEVGRQVVDERFNSLGQDFIEQLCNKHFLKAYLQELHTWENNFQKRMEGYATDVLSLLEQEGLCTTDFIRKKNSFMRYFDKVKEGDYAPPDTLRQALDDPSKWSAKNDPQAARITSIFPTLNRLIKSCIDYYDAESPLWHSIRCALRLLPSLGLAADVLRHTRNLLNNDNAVHLSQTLQLLSTLATNNDTPFILERMGCRYTHFLVDEFQDTSVLQWKVLLPLLHNGLAQGGASLVVGDVKQSIYRWRNSDWRILGEEISKDLYQYHPKDVYLGTNWRSREVLVDGVGALFDQLIEDVYQEFVSNLPQPDSGDEMERYGAIPYEIKKAYTDIRQQIAPTKKGSGGYITITSVESAKESAKGQKAQEQVLERLPFLIMELQKRGFSASDIAILVRKNDEGQQVASTLMSFKERPEAQGFCFDVVSPDSLFLYQSLEIQLLIAIMKRFVYPDDALNNLIVAHLSARLDTACPDSLWTGALQHKALPELFEELLRCLKWTERSNAFAYIQELHNQILNFSNAHSRQAADAFSFVRWWEQYGKKISLTLERSGNAIEITTIHKSKGLQYPVVIIPFCQWELDYKWMQAPLLWVPVSRLPSDKCFAPLTRLPFIPQRYGSEMKQGLFAFDYYCEKMQYLIDQLNVFYVAATRAEDELHLFLPQPANSSHNLATLLKKKCANSTCFTVGAPVQREQPPPDAQNNTLPLKYYASATPSFRLKVRLANETPMEERVSPQKRGLILHQLLSHIHTAADLDTAINKLIDNGMIANNPTECAQYAQLVREALAQPQAAEWFDGSWLVRNEASILLPSMGSHTLRPDRVMERDGHILIIDYKFGAPHVTHQRQMDKYIETLKQMGYKQVEGYVWYV